MSALTEEVAREHRHWAGLGECRCGASIPETGCGDDRDLYAAHIAEVTEAAVRAAVAADIERAAVMETCSCPSCDCGGTNHDRLSGLYDAARIAEGKQP